jgi:hypothetical protein
MAWYTCPHCGEEVDTAPDPGEDARVEYVEDCPVCCRPNVLCAEYDRDADDFVVTARRES